MYRVLQPRIQYSVYEYDTIRDDGGRELGLSSSTFWRPFGVFKKEGE